MKHLLVKALLIYLFSFSLVCFAFAEQNKSSSYQIPEGFQNMVVYFADGEFDFASPNPSVPNCYHIFCVGNYWFEKILKKNPTEILNEQINAKAFFLKRFGLDVDQLVDSNQATLMPFYNDPRMNYRARIVGNYSVHKLGWEVHDGGIALVLGTELTLGGDWAGVKVSPGTMMVYGGYAIQPSILKENSHQKRLVNSNKLIVIRYQSGEPILPPGPSGAIFFRCEIVSSPWGSGIAQGINNIVPKRDGIEPMSVVKMATRNTLSFSGNGGLGNYAGVHNDPNLVIEKP